MELIHTRDAIVTGCTFDSVGGNGMLVSRYNGQTLIEGNEFKWTGNSSTVLLGQTSQICDLRH
jgi:hypothetical protein